MKFFRLFSKRSDIVQTKQSFTRREASDISKELGINFSKVKFNLDDFYAGLNVELEHGTRSFSTNVTNDDPIMTGKIALAHLNEFPDYYTRLTQLEKEADEYWKDIPKTK